MLKLFFIILALFVLNMSAYASKARLDALGQPTDGSFYIDDTRNIFLNPASINVLKDYVIFEWGNRGGYTNDVIIPGNTTIDVDETDVLDKSQAEGGYVRSIGNFVWGVFFGAEDDDKKINRARIDLQGNTSNSVTPNFNGFLEEDNRVDIFFGGDAGLQWGLNISYANNDDEQAQGFAKKQSSLGVKLGLYVGEIEWYADYDLKDESNGAALSNDLYEDDGSWTIGFVYRWSNYKFYTEYETDIYTGTYNNTARSGDQVDFRIGGAQINKLSDKAMFILAASYEIDKLELSSQGTKNYKFRGLPLLLALEAEATNWLTLRGSVTHTLFSSYDNANQKPASLANSTKVAAGGTFNFGRLDVDTAIGIDTDGDEEFGRFSLSYWF